jgi:hypothetical protein
VNTVGSQQGRRAVVVCVMILIAADQVFQIGHDLQGNLYALYCSYFADVYLPFGLYLLLCLAEADAPILRPWERKLAIAFLLPSLAETGQYLGIYVLGATFDPFDYLAYGVGAISAAIVDMRVFPRIFTFWAEGRVD